MPNQYPNPLLDKILDKAGSQQTGLMDLLNPNSFMDPRRAQLEKSGINTALLKELVLNKLKDALVNRTGPQSLLEKYGKGRIAPSQTMPDVQ